MPVSGGASCALCQEQLTLLKGPAGLPLHARRCPLGPWDCWPQTLGPVKPGVTTPRLGASLGTVLLTVPYHHLVTELGRTPAWEGAFLKNLPAMRETQVQSLGWEDLLEEGMAAH